MDASEYIDTVTGQMRSKRARAMVAKELSDHIADQTDSYLKAGMSLKEAQEEAVRQMGDAVEVGMEMDAIHRPRMDKRVLWIVGIFSAAACFLQTFVLQAQHYNGWDYGSRREVPFEVAAGVAIMLLILFVDYTFIGRYALQLWGALLGILLLVLPLGEGLGRAWLAGGYISYGRDRFLAYVSCALFLPLFAGVVYRLRKRGWPGIAASLALLFLGDCILAGTGSGLFPFSFVQNLLMGVLLVAYSIAKGWYPISRAKGLAAFGTLVAGGTGAFLAFCFLRGSYSWERMLYFVGWKAWDPYGLDSSGHRRLDYINGVLDHVALFGGEETSRDLLTMPHCDIAFLDVLDRVGLVGGAAIFVGLAALCIVMAYGVSKQKNVLGGMIGAACVLNLFVPTVFHCLNSLGMVPPTDALIPFLYPGATANAACYTLLGLYLSVYRNKDII